MSKKCIAFSVSKLGLESADNRKAFYAGWDAAIAAAEKQEPFGYFRYDLRLDAWVQNRDSNKGVAFYTYTQPKREWVGLTDEEIANIANGCRWSDIYHADFAHAIEAKLREQNGC